MPVDPALQPDTLRLRAGDALLVVDMQRDFLPGGALGVAGGDALVPLLNVCTRLFAARALPCVFSRDWHPPDHISFAARGGPWPPHCVAGTPGAAFADGLELPAGAYVLSKADTRDADAYSAFQDTGLAGWLRRHGCRRLFVGGLASDYCVRASVLDALAECFEVCLLGDAVRAVEASPGDGARAIAEMHARGARPASVAQLADAAR